MLNNNRRLGLCCLLVGDHKTQFRSIKRTWAQNHPDEIANRLKEVWLHNIAETCRVLNYCVDNNIWCYRLSSDLFGLADLPEYKDLWNAFKANDNNWTYIRRCVSSYIQQGGRLSTHPGQFCVISNDDLEITNRSVLALDHHADFFDAMQIPKNYFFPINIHISNGRKEQQAADNVYRNMNLLSESTRLRLVFETEDKNYWTYQRIHKHFPHIPITLDYHHRLINNLGEDEQQAHEVCVQSWHQHNIKPLFHYTEGREHDLDRKHADFIRQLPSYNDIDLEIEAKQKNLAILKALQEAY